MEGVITMPPYAREHLNRDRNENNGAEAPAKFAINTNPDRDDWSREKKQLDHAMIRQDFKRSREICRSQMLRNFFGITR